MMGCITTYASWTSLLSAYLDIILCNDVHVHLVENYHLATDDKIIQYLLRVGY